MSSSKIWSRTEQRNSDLELWVTKAILSTAVGISLGAGRKNDLIKFYKMVKINGKVYLRKYSLIVSSSVSHGCCSFFFF